MKRSFILAVFYLIISAISFAQVPQKMSYQAVVRGSDNNLVVNQNVAMRVSILQGSADGTAVYTETHSAQTNANGLVSIEIGNGTSNGDFASIDWTNGPYFVKTETDVNGGENYEIVGVSQMLTVPYAMYSQTSGNVPGYDALRAEVQYLSTIVRSGHDYVDLGLPSGTKWATCNLGATSPEEYGDYFAWGETTTKTTYTLNNYTYTDNPNVLPYSADAATVNWGICWRMPTKEEFEELKNNCTIAWTTQNGVTGQLFTGPNGNSIFLPAAGFRYNSSLLETGENGHYWSSSIQPEYPDNVWSLNSESSHCTIYTSLHRNYGGSVRAVLAE